MREEGAVMAVLHDTAANRDLIAAATHLCGDLKLPDVRLAQANALFKELWSFGVAHGATDAPLIVSGDFNSLWRRCVPLEDNEVSLHVEPLITQGYETSRWSLTH